MFPGGFWFVGKTVNLYMYNINNRPLETVELLTNYFYNILSYCHACLSTLFPIEALSFKWK
jgi:hypothetical protein